MKEKFVNPFEVNKIKQQFQNLASDKDLVTMRVNGRSYQFNKDGSVIVVEGLKQVELDNVLFENDLSKFCSIVDSICCEKCIDDTCFMCRYFKHLDPDTDVCNITGEVRYFDSLKCEAFEIYMGEDNA